jgi:hypothetical protein
LTNYTVGTNATGIMCRFYSPWTIINGKETKTRGYCYIFVQPFAAELPPPDGKKWFDILPPTKTRESHRLKRVRCDDEQVIAVETDDAIVDSNQPDSDCRVKMPMPMDYEFDPWDDKKIKRKLFAPEKDEHPMDAIARRIDKLMEARKSVVGYKDLIFGGDPYENCTEVEKIKLQDKAIYLIAALRSALNSYPKITWTDCCKQACVTCSEITTPYCWRTIQDWWSIYKINDGFIHPRGEEGQIKKSKENLPPFLRDNEDLHKKFVRHCTSNLNDLSTDSAKEYVTDHLIPMGFPLTSDFTAMDRENLLQELYGLSSTPVRSTIWDWLVRCGFNYTKRKKKILCRYT